jgi:hypothetical protein
LALAEVHLELGVALMEQTLYFQPSLQPLEAVEVVVAIMVVQQ